MNRIESRINHRTTEAGAAIAPAASAREPVWPRRGSRARAIASALAAAIVVATLGACDAEQGSDGMAEPGAADSAATSGGAEAAETAGSMPAPTEPDTLAATEAGTHEIEVFEKMGGMQDVRVITDGKGGIVLEGTVKTADRKQTAEDVARRITGVTSVENRIVVTE